MRWRDPERVFIGLGIASLVPLWSFYLVAVVWYIDVLDLSAFRLIMLGTALEVSLLVSEIPTGVVADRFSRKWSVVLSFMLTGVSMLLHPISTNFAVLLATQVLFGFGWSFRSGADVAWFTAEFEDGDRVSQVIVARQRWVLISAALTIPFVVLLGLWSLRITIALTGAVTVAAGLVLAFVMVDHRLRADSDPSSGEIFRQGFSLCRRVPTLRRLMVVLLLVGLGAEAVDRLGFKRFIDEGDFGTNTLVFTGVLFVVLAFGGSLMVTVAESRLDRGVRFALVVGGLVALASLGAALVALAPVVGVAIGMLAQDTTRETLDPVAMAWANTEAEEASRATVHSFLSQAHGVGEIAGGFLAAGIATAAGVSPALLVSAALFGLAAVWAATARADDDAPAPANVVTTTKP